MGYEITVKSFSQGTILKLIIDSVSIEAILGHIKTLQTDHEILKIKKQIPIVGIECVAALDQMMLQ